MPELHPNSGVGERQTPLGIHPPEMATAFAQAFKPFWHPQTSGPVESSWASLLGGSVEPSANPSAEASGTAPPTSASGRSPTVSGDVRSAAGDASRAFWSAAASLPSGSSDPEQAAASSHPTAQTTAHPRPTFLRWLIRPCLILYPRYLRFSDAPPSAGVHSARSAPGQCRCLRRHTTSCYHGAHAAERVDSRPNLPWPLRHHCS
jgi:hypothetical protein